MAAVNNFAAFTPGLDSPATGAAAITPHDTNELTTVSRYIYVGGTGNLKLTTVTGETVTFESIPVGTVLRIAAKLVFSTGTTATKLVAMY